MNVDHPLSGNPHKLRFLGLALAAIGALILGGRGGAFGGSWPVASLEALSEMGPAQLDQVYRQAGPGPVPEGRVRGRALLYPGTKLAKPASRFARILWQGKVFRSEDSTAINRFVGVRIIRGRIYMGPSWLDGRPSMILDYEGTSVVYGKNRDEIRQVGPNLYLGLMYARTKPSPSKTMYFALQTSP